MARKHVKKDVIRKKPAGAGFEFYLKGHLQIPAEGYKLHFLNVYFCRLNIHSAPVLAIVLENKFFVF